jgi:hypothetical protein
MACSRCFRDRIATERFHGLRQFRRVFRFQCDDFAAVGQAVFRYRRGKNRYGCTGSKPAINNLRGENGYFSIRLRAGVTPRTKQSVMPQLEQTLSPGVPAAIPFVFVARLISCA